MKDGTRPTMRPGQRLDRAIASGDPWLQKAEEIRFGIPYQYAFITQTVHAVDGGSTPGGLACFRRSESDEVRTTLLPPGRMLVEALAEYAKWVGRELERAANDPEADDGEEELIEWLREECVRVVAVEASLRAMLHERDESPDISNHRITIERLSAYTSRGRGKSDVGFVNDVRTRNKLDT